MVTEAISRRVVRVPDVSNKTLEKARILLEDSGLRKIVVLYRESYEDRDTVLEQRPARGQMIYEGSEVAPYPTTKTAATNPIQSPIRFGGLGTGR